MKERSVTVIVTAKNAGKTIEKCVESLMKQNYKGYYEVYVSDAYSTDGTWEKLKSLKKKYGKKLRIERIHGNIARAHNIMISKVKTDIIAFTDADCVADRSWLRELVSGLNEEGVIAAGGYCGTPKKVNFLQKVIGKELERRFKKFPKYISRAPTMNLCVYTKYAKKVKFDENLDVAQETDWGYRITKYGKMKYVPSAKVWHYHRATLKNYFLQQLNYGKEVPKVYLRKHRKMIKGDHISTTSMLLQLLLFDITLLALLFSFFEKNYLIGALMLAFLFVFYSADIVKVTKKPKEFLTLLFLYLLRSLAWTIGISIGILNILNDFN